MRTLAATLALLACLAAACAGGEPPPPTPEATSTPAPTAAPTPDATSTPAPTGAATPEVTSTPAPAAGVLERALTLRAAFAATPEARSGLDLIEPAPGAFVHRTFGDGEAIDWTHGIFVFDVETKLTEGYALTGVEHYARDDGGYSAQRGGWIEAWEYGEDRKLRRLLLDRETMRSWRLPLPPSLVLEATSEGHLLFSERTGPTGRFILVNRMMEEIARSSFDGGVRSAMFTPDGSAIVLAADKVYLVPVATGRPAILFDPPLRHDEHEELRLLGTGVHSRRLPPLGYSWAAYEGGPGIVATASYAKPGKDLYEPDEVVRERRYFSWDGEELPAPACPGTMSPDGRYTAVLDGEPFWERYGAFAIERENLWPSVVIADAETCAPIFRVRSAYTYQLRWRATWLPTSEGIVVGVRGDGYAIARVAPEPSLALLPHGWPGPIPAPTEGDRYFGYGGARVYDAAEDRWYGPPDTGVPFWWGSTHRERWFHSPIYWGEGGYSWLLLPPKIEYPPFAEEIAFRVARTGSCLRLREEPGEDGSVLACLPDGERLRLAEHAEPDYWPPHPSIVLTGTPKWVYVRTGDGAEGWVSHDYLDHD